MSQDIISLKVEMREVLGKAVKHMRRDGIIPAVIHDHGKDSLHVQAVYVEIYKVWKLAGKHHPIQLTAGDKTFTVLIKSADFDPHKHKLTHIVFNAVDKNQKVEASIPVRARYDEGNESSPAERAGLIVLTQLDEVEVRAIASKLPDFLDYNAEVLVEIGDHVTVGDLIVPEGVELETELTHSLATVYEPGALAAANDAAGGDAEEVAPADEEAVEGETPVVEGEAPATETEAPKAE